MLLSRNRFYNNSLYKILSNKSIYSNELLQELNSLLHQEPDLSELSHPKEGSYFHIVCRNSHGQENVAFRMIYTLSNAGADPNITDEKGNTPLHEVLIQDYGESGLDLIQALFRVGVDSRIINHEGKTADAYLGKNSQLTAFYKSYGEGIWSAIETNNIQETERLIKGFIKVDCKHNSNKTLMNKACDLNYTSIINILADYQVTNEFIHSILACDWDRTLLIYEYEKQFLKINSYDSIHRLTSIRKYSKSLLEYCLDTYSSKPFDILFNSSIININLNILCTDGLPFFFHCFNENISNNIRKIILFYSNMYMKSYKGETFLFYLIDLYIENEKQEYLYIFINILYYNPLILTERNQQEQTIIEYIEFRKSLLNYNKLRPFYNAIMNILIIQLKNHKIIEKYILNSFGYYLLLFFKGKYLQMTKNSYNLIRSLKYHRGLSILILNLIQTIIDDDLIKLQKIFKIKSNIYYAKDSFGRTCLHLAVLYQRYIILKFICDKCNDIIDTRDNLNRTSLHYACIMNDKASIEILEKANAKQLIDCMNFYPNDYLFNRNLCCNECHAENFQKNFLEQKSLASSNYLKLAFYLKFKKAIENNSIENIKSLNNEINTMGFYLKDFNSNSYLNDYIQGQRYIPLLFIALQHRSFASIQCLIELGIPLIGQIYISKSIKRQYSKWMSFSSKTNELEYIDIIDIINKLEDDIELKNIFKQNSIPIETITNENLIKTEQENNSNLEKLLQRQKLLNFFRRHQNMKSATCILS